MLQMQTCRPFGKQMILGVQQKQEEMLGGAIAVYLVSNDNLVEPNHNKDTCKWCTASRVAGNPNLRCYHHCIVTEQVAAVMEEELKALDEIFLGMLNKVGVFKDASLILTTKNPKVATTSARNNPSSIHFSLVSCTRQVINEYNSKIKHDLEIRGMDSTSADLEERQQRLQTQMIEERTSVRLRPNIEENRE
ncbi:hypothetical protein ACA910_018794 [Epithemia clementina (nom. ined.)]